jgi:hypothetical protein
MSIRRHNDGLPLGNLLPLPLVLIRVGFGELEPGVNGVTDHQTFEPNTGESSHTFG